MAAKQQNKALTCPLTGCTIVPACGVRLYKCLTCLAETWLAPALDLLIRLYMGWIFFKSGMLKLENWDSTLLLFQYEYALPVIPHDIAAYLATAGELALPALLVLGLGTRFAALGLVIMTAVIELLVFNNQQHLFWMMLLGMIALRGAGRFSLDHLVATKCPACKVIH